MLEAAWDARDLVAARLDAGEFDGRLPQALLDLSPAQLREVEWILIHSLTPQSDPNRRATLENLNSNARLN